MPLRRAGMRLQIPAPAPTGSGCPWLKKNLRFDRRTATNYMKVASNWETVSQLHGP